MSPRRPAGFVTSRSALVVITAMAAALLVWWRAGSTPMPPSVMLITLDTTRADHLSPYGLMDVPMPALDRLAREGTVFDRAYTVVPLTLPAHASLFTGLFPPAHGVRDNLNAGLPCERTTLAEMLRAQGYRTGAFVGSIVLDPARGLAQGFEVYQAVPPGTHGQSDGRQRRGEAVVDDALRWLEEVGEAPVFMWVHLYDPHHPYDPPEPFRSRYGDSYVGEIAYADTQVARLLAALERRGLFEQAVVVVAADHGESLGEHGERGHGVFVYDEVLRVPLIIRAPGLGPGRIGATVRLVDVMPTVLDLCGIEVPPVQGVSLTGLMRGSNDTPRLAAYGESRYPLRFGWSPLRMLQVDRYKLIEAPRPELYDLVSDPYEETNLFESRRPVAEAMMRQLVAMAMEIEREAAAPSSMTAVTPDLRDRIASLGYVGGLGAADGAPMSGLPDPKDCLPNRRAPERLAEQPSRTCPAAPGVGFDRD